MPLFLTVSEGTSVAEARPILATSDQKVLKAVGRLLAERLDPEDLVAKIQLIRSQTDVDDEDVDEQ